MHEYICPNCGYQLLLRSRNTSFFSCQGCHVKWCIIDLSIINAPETKAILYGQSDTHDPDGPIALGKINTIDKGVSL